MPGRVMEFGGDPLPLPPQAEGQAVLHRLPSGIIVGCEHYRLTENCLDRLESYEIDYLQFHMRLSGHSEVAAHGIGNRAIDPSTLGVLIHPAGAPKNHYRHATPAPYESVTLLCSCESLARLAEQAAASLPRPVAAFMEGRAEDFYLECLPLRREMAQAARAILDCTIASAVRHLFIEAKTLELLFHSLDLLQDRAKAGEDDGLTRREVQRLHEAQSILHASFDRPPTIRALARQVGLNEPRLCSGFKTLFGATIYDYVLHLRMNEAMRLLRDTDRSITEIAFDVGYEYPGNFSTAFKRIFGLTPKAARAGATRAN